MPDFSNSTRRAEADKFDAYTCSLPELMRTAQDEGWLKALEKVVRPLPDVGPGIVSYATDEAKGDLTYLMNIRPEQNVLDLGCGLGQVSVAIAGRGAKCYAIDISHPQVVFTVLRCHQMGLANIHGACGGDDMKLPVADGFFDAVVMNGVLEWLGCAERYGGPPEAAQLAMLKEVHRALKTGGQLYVASKNRFALLHLLGGEPDHGTRLPWVGILHARLQRVLTFSRLIDSGARIYGLQGYRRLFAAAGFAEKAVYALTPNFRHPKRVVPLGKGFGGRLRRSGTRELYNRRLEGAVFRVLPSVLLEKTVYCYGFLLAKR